MFSQEFIQKTEFYTSEQTVLPQHLIKWLSGKKNSVPPQERLSSNEDELAISPGLTVAVPNSVSRSVYIANCWELGDYTKRKITPYNALFPVLFPSNLLQTTVREEPCRSHIR